MESGQVNEAFVAGEDSLKDENEEGTPELEKGNSQKTTTIPDLPPVPFHALFRFASSLDLFFVFVAVVSACGTGVCLPIMLVLFGDVTNALVNSGAPGISNGNGYSCKHNASSLIANVTFQEGRTDSMMDEFVKFGVYTSVVGVVRFALAFTFLTLLNYAAENQTYRIRSRFLQSILRQDISWYDTKSSNAFASRITEDLNKIQDGIGEKIGMFLYVLTIFISSMLTAFLHGWELTLIMLISTPVLAIAMGIVSKVQNSLTVNELKTYAKAGGVAEEVISSIRTVMAFEGQQKEIERFKENLVFARKAGIKRGLATAIGSGLMLAVSFASYALVFWYGVNLILESCGKEDGYTPSDLLIVFFNVLIGAMQIGKAVPYLEAFSVARGAAASIFDIIDRVPAIDSSSEAGEKPETVQGNIAFENVRFNYPSRPDVEILRGLSFDVPAGQTVALVGTSGCGKSTCIQLLQRFYDSLEGAIRIDDNNIKDLHVGWLRSQMGIVGQEPILFGTTIAENIRYGRSGVSQEEIEKAAKEANAHDFILGLPLKYETQVGERGAQLSGGQKQRIAIARALVRNPKILLLDEATSALDVQSEAVVQRALDKARLGRTTIIVAHRLTTIRNADRIIVFKDGVIEEEGTHKDLMAKKGVYLDLVVSQQSGIEKKEPGNRPRDPEPDYMEDSDDDDLSKHRRFILHQTNEFADRISLGSSRSSGRGSIMSKKKGRRINSKLFIKPAEVPDVADEEQATTWDIMKMNKKEWPYICVGIVSAAIVGLNNPIYAILFAEVMGSLTPAGSEKDLIEKRSQGNYYSLMFLILGLVVGVASFFQNFCFSVAGESLTSRLRKLAFKSILRQEVGWFDKSENNVGSLCTRLSGDASHVQGATGSRIGIACEAMSTAVACIVISFYYEWRLGLVAMSFVPPLLLPTIWQAKITMEQTSIEREGIQQSVKIATEAISNIRTVAGLGKEKEFHEKFMESLRFHYEQNLKRSLIRGFVGGLANSVFMFGYAATLYYGGWLVTYQNANFKHVIAVSEALIMGTFSVGEALSFAPNYGKAKVAANRIFALLRRVPQIDASSTDGVQLQNVAGNVNFHQVDFRYPTRESAQVLQGLKLAVKAGQTVALVGHSGCGKSTCIQLLERFYDPDAGHIKIDSQDTKSANISSLRSQLGIVSQEPILFNRTIGENIAYGDNSRTVQMEEIIEAARKANIHTFIQSLPNGYDTMVGEKGTQLSGGQKQRIAIARALVRNPKILLLDEATSALDSESEQVVQMALDAAREGRTCITIAHRLSTIQNADNIIVINHGKIAEQGTHDELLKKRGLYFELCSAQGIFHKSGSNPSELKKTYL